MDHPMPEISEAMQAAMRATKVTLSDFLHTDPKIVRNVRGATSTIIKCVCLKLGCPMTAAFLNIEGIPGTTVFVSQVVPDSPLEEMLLRVMGSAKPPIHGDVLMRHLGTTKESITSGIQELLADLVLRLHMQKHTEQDQEWSKTIPDVEYVTTIAERLHSSLASPEALQQVKAFCKDSVVMTDEVNENCNSFIAEILPRHEQVMAAYDRWLTHATKDD